jgi:archaemetzincin
MPDGCDEGLNLDISLLPVGMVDEDIMRLLARGLARRFGRARVLSNAKVPREAFVPRRGQYLSHRFIKMAEGGPGEKVLAVTHVDIYSPGVNYLFGQAQVGGRACTISLSRLHHPNRSVFEERALKEAFHEIGHTMGLRHCDDPMCVMHFSNSIANTDRKGQWFCPRCERELLRILSGE